MNIQAFITARQNAASNANDLLVAAAGGTGVTPDQYERLTNPNPRNNAAPGYYRGWQPLQRDIMPGVGKEGIANKISRKIFGGDPSTNDPNRTNIRPAAGNLPASPTFMQSVQFWKTPNLGVAPVVQAQQLKERREASFQEWVFEKDFRINEAAAIALEKEKARILALPIDQQTPGEYRMAERLCAEVMGIDHTAARAKYYSAALPYVIHGAFIQLSAVLPSFFTLPSFGSTGNALLENSPVGAAVANLVGQIAMSFGTTPAYRGIVQQQFFSVTRELGRTGGIASREVGLSSAPLFPALSKDLREKEQEAIDARTQLEDVTVNATTTTVADRNQAKQDADDAKAALEKSIKDYRQRMKFLATNEDGQLFQNIYRTTRAGTLWLIPILSAFAGYREFEIVNLATGGQKKIDLYTHHAVGAASGMLLIPYIFGACTDETRKWTGAFHGAMFSVDLRSPEAIAANLTLNDLQPGQGHINNTLLRKIWGGVAKPRLKMMGDILTQDVKNLEKEMASLLSTHGGIEERLTQLDLARHAKYEKKLRKHEDLPTDTVATQRIGVINAMAANAITPALIAERTNLEEIIEFRRLRGVTNAQLAAMPHATRVAHFAAWKAAEEKFRQPINTANAAADQASSKDTFTKLNKLAPLSSMSREMWVELDRFRDNTFHPHLQITPAGHTGPNPNPMTARGGAPLTDAQLETAINALPGIPPHVGAGPAPAPTPVQEAQAGAKARLQDLLRRSRFSLRPEQFLQLEILRDVQGHTIDLTKATTDFNHLASRTTPALTNNEKDDYLKLLAKTAWDTAAPLTGPERTLLRTIETRARTLRDPALRDNADAPMEMFKKAASLIATGLEPKQLEQWQSINGKMVTAEANCRANAAHATTLDDLRGQRAHIQTDKKINLKCDWTSLSDHVSQKLDQVLRGNIGDDLKTTLQHGMFRWDTVAENRMQIPQSLGTANQFYGLGGANMSFIMSGIYRVAKAAGNEVPPGWRVGLNTAILGLTIMSAWNTPNMINDKAQIRRELRTMEPDEIPATYNFLPLVNRSMVVQAKVFKDYNGILETRLAKWMGIYAEGAKPAYNKARAAWHGLDAALTNYNAAQAMNTAPLVVSFPGMPPGGGGPPNPGGLNPGGLNPGGPNPGGGGPNFGGPTPPLWRVIGNPLTGGYISKAPQKGSGSAVAVTVPVSAMEAVYRHTYMTTLANDFADHLYGMLGDTVATLSEKDRNVHEDEYMHYLRTTPEGADRLAQIKHQAKQETFHLYLEDKGLATRDDNAPIGQEWTLTEDGKDEYQSQYESVFEPELRGVIAAIDKETVINDVLTRKGKQFDEFRKQNGLLNPDGQPKSLDEVLQDPKLTDRITDVLATIGSNFAEVAHEASQQTWEESLRAANEKRLVEDEVAKATQGLPGSFPTSAPELPPGTIGVALNSIMKGAIGFDDNTKPAQEAYWDAMIAESVRGSYQTRNAFIATLDKKQISLQEPSEELTKAAQAFAKDLAEKQKILASAMESAKLKLKDSDLNAAHLNDFLDLLKAKHPASADISPDDLAVDAKQFATFVKLQHDALSTELTNHKIPDNSVNFDEFREQIKTKYSAAPEKIQDIKTVLRTEAEKYVKNVAKELADQTEELLRAQKNDQELSARHEALKKALDVESINIEPASIQVFSSYLNKVQGTSNDPISAEDLTKYAANFASQLKEKMAALTAAFDHHEMPTELIGHSDIQDIEESMSAASTLTEGNDPQKPISVEEFAAAAKKIAAQVAAQHAANDRDDTRSTSSYATTLVDPDDGLSDTSGKSNATETATPVQAKAALLKLLNNEYNKGKFLNDANHAEILKQVENESISFGINAIADIQTILNKANEHAKFEIVMAPPAFTGAKVVVGDTNSTNALISTENPPHVDPANLKPIQKQVIRLEVVVRAETQGAVRGDIITRDNTNTVTKTQAPPPGKTQNLARASSPPPGITSGGGGRH